MSRKSTPILDGWEIDRTVEVLLGGRRVCRIKVGNEQLDPAEVEHTLNRGDQATIVIKMNTAINLKHKTTGLADLDEQLRYLPHDVGRPLIAGFTITPTQPRQVQRDPEDDDTLLIENIRISAFSTNGSEIAFAANSRHVAWLNINGYVWFDRKP